MSDLAAMVAFVRARLGEDEATARDISVLADPEERGVSRAHWMALRSASGGDAFVIDADDPDYAIIADTLDELAIYMARHDPARVLREVEAMRAIVDLHKVNSEPAYWGGSHPDPAMRGKPAGYTVYWCDWCDHDRDYGHISSPQEGCPTLRHVAGIWRDHPDYDPGWAWDPET